MITNILVLLYHGSTTFFSSLLMCILSLKRRRRNRVVNLFFFSLCFSTCQIGQVRLARRIVLVILTRSISNQYEKENERERERMYIDAYQITRVTFFFFDIIILIFRLARRTTRNLIGEIALPTQRSTSSSSSNIYHINQ